MTAHDMGQRYHDSLRRYAGAMENRAVDRVPIRPFVAEFTARYAGYTCQQVTHDYRLAFEAAVRCAREFDWDAVVANMVYVWTGLTEGAGLRYYGVPGIDVPADVGFQYREPPEGAAFMQEGEYDELIDDPTRYLYEVWLPRVSTRLAGRGQPVTYAHSLALVRSAMGMMGYFADFGPQVRRLREECGVASAIAGILKAPMDILADKLRGYMGLLEDLEVRPGKVRAACEALAPHLLHVAVATADPDRVAPVGLWMHRGCVPLVNPATFDGIYWPTLRPIIEELWSRRIRTLFYAEGNWDYHLETFAKLPEASIVFHVDRGDIARAVAVLGGRFCLSGGVPNALLAFGTPSDVRQRCRELIAATRGRAAYIMDASAIVQNDATVENVRAMTQFTREYGVSSGGSSADERPRRQPTPPRLCDGLTIKSSIPPGVCEPYEAYRARRPAEATGDETLTRRVWAEVDGMANMYVWQMLLSF